MTVFDENYWSNRYKFGQTGWDIGYPSTPIVQFLDQIEKKEVEILIPGAGNGYEALYAFNCGFKNVNILDFSSEPLRRFKLKSPEFPDSNIHHEDFFYHNKNYDLILEQTFFCALDPSLRPKYVSKMIELLKPGGKLVGLLFNRVFDKDGPPFGGSLKEYQSLFEEKFHELSITNCYNSIPERAGAEFFFQAIKSKV
ncbi:methyltransferase domain-containing protein [Algoriphagus sp.]|uniref:methyltransferase domain-containing protein n=1 Tax=Algoriphagus sp. TaxID=1872435 RepID=UPI0025D15376|nr:methyltransferase domain-containing protein [Algoriphagus sp.]